MTGRVDFNPLVTTLTRAELRAYKAGSRAERDEWRESGADNALIHFQWALALTVALTLPSGFIALMLAQPHVGPALLPGVIIATIVGLTLVALDVYRIVKIYQLRTPDWSTLARLDRFARANGLGFSPVETQVRYPGVIFTVGTSGRSLNVIHSTVDRVHDFGTYQTTTPERVLSIGNFEYSIATDNDTESYEWGFMAIRLERNLPNMVLDAKANNRFRRTNLPRFFDKRQVLSLEGDFDRFFTLYCPRRYERDALYIFTPDLMALLIDEASPFDVEIVDDWMFIYSSRPFTSTDPTVYERLLRIAATVGNKALSQSRRYSDGRMGDFAANLVNYRGKSLKYWYLPWRRRTIAVTLAVATVLICGILASILLRDVPQLHP